MIAAATATAEAIYYLHKYFYYVCNIIISVLLQRQKCVSTTVRVTLLIF